MKFAFITLLITGSAFAYTSSPADNKRVRDPAWTFEKREPASVEVKAQKPMKETPKKGAEALK